MVCFLCNDLETLKEAAGRGANEFVFYVSNGPETEFSRLPDVLPDQIILARQMRRYFSGDLTAAVKGYPRFPWPEASYLRAQVFFSCDPLFISSLF